MNATREGLSRPDARFPDWPSSYFPGISFNPETLHSEVIDEQLCAAALNTAPNPGDRVFVLLAKGRNNEAAELVAELRMADPGSLRLQVLEADVAASVNDTDRAIRLLQYLAKEQLGKAAEASVRQHLGRAYFRAGKYQSAAGNFAAALDLRVAAGASAALIYSSTVALQRARELLECTASVA